MLGRLAGVLSANKIERIESSVLADLEAEKLDAAQKGIQSLLRAQPRSRDAALALIRIVDAGPLPIERGLAVFEAVFGAHASDPELLVAMGNTASSVRDIDDLNAAPPASPLYSELADALDTHVQEATDTEMEEALLFALANTTRMMARQRDEVCARAYRRLTELAPDTGYHHYNLGLYCKTRGLFHEGLRANQAAARLADEPSDALDWNLGICATGAGEGAVALALWKRRGQKMELGRFGLPDGGYPHCKVKLAQRPLAERDSTQDDPGLEETIWVERLSPCHGIVRSALYQRLGVDYGDVVLFDGAPITYHTSGEKKIPVFPHLATLVRPGYHLYDFAGTQESPRQLADASTALADDAVIYSHTEQFVQLCEACWRSEATDHANHTKTAAHVVVGRIAAPPHIEPAELLRQLDAAMAERAPCRIYVPELCEAAGMSERAEVERRRFGMVASTEGQ